MPAMQGPVFYRNRFDMSLLSVKNADTIPFDFGRFSVNAWPFFGLP
jgi:hypothetical protein